MLDMRSGRISGAEAVLRWERPGREQPLPADFFQIVEETAPIEPIGEWAPRKPAGNSGVAERLMMRRACRWMSARQFRQRRFVETVR
jgi:EAL domain-containing protein (putative c-di-GMP-specific phosphodiesterase class I)